MPVELYVLLRNFTLHIQDNVLVLSGQLRINAMIIYKFEVRTDNNPLTYVLGKAKLDATSQRWIAALASYDFSLTYMCSKSNTVVESLSRLDQDRLKLFSDAVKVICDAILVSPSCPSAESILMSQSFDALVDGDDLGVNELCDAFWTDEQKRDTDIARVIELKRVGQKLTKRQISK